MGRFGATGQQCGGEGALVARILLGKGMGGLLFIAGKGVMVCGART
jgi:hypothetical protein